MTYRMLPIITIRNLLNELESRYNITFENTHFPTLELGRILWGESRTEGFERYHFGDGLIELSWRDERDVYIENCVISILMDNFGKQFDEVLIDVFW